MMSCSIITLNGLNLRYSRKTTEAVIYEDDVFEIAGKLCEKVLEVLKTAPGVIIDHVITSERIFYQLKEMLSSYLLHMIRVTCPLEVLQKREAARKNRCPGSAKASCEYLYPKEGYDLSVDTHIMTARECSVKIYEELLKN